MQAGISLDNQEQEECGVYLTQTGGADVISLFSGFLELPRFTDGQHALEIEAEPESVSQSDLERGKIEGSPVLPFDKEPTDSLNELLTIGEVAALFKISSMGVRRLLSRRLIPFFKVGGVIRFMPSDITFYLQRQRVAAIG